MKPKSLFGIYIKPTTRLAIFMLIFIGALFMANNVRAKIKDPGPLQFNGITFSSHMTSVIATDSSNKKLWGQKVYDEPKYIGTYNNRVEEDVQWNIIASLNEDQGRLRITSKRGDIYYLDPKTGKIE